MSGDCSLYELKANCNRNSTCSLVFTYYFWSAKRVLLVGPGECQIVLTGELEIASLLVSQFIVHVADTLSARLHRKRFTVKRTCNELCGREHVLRLPISD